MTDEKPPVLKNPNRLLKLLAILLVAFVVIYIGVAATSFLRTENTEPDPRMTGTEAPLEQAMPPSD